MQKPHKRPTGMRGRYLYAIVGGSDQRSYGDLGLNGSTVYTISNGSVSAIVSDVPNEKIRPERRHLAAHQAVLRKVMEDRDLLPMAFGIISAGHEAVGGFLSRNRKAISSQLRRIQGRVEMGLRVSWDVLNIFEYMVNIHPGLRNARDRLLDPQSNPSTEEKIEVGRMFEELLNADRDRHTEQVEGVLGPRCAEIKRNQCRGEREVMNLACLVGRSSLTDFEAAVLEAAGFFDDNFAFDYNGPWAPHNFVDMDADV